MSKESNSSDPHETDKAFLKSYGHENAVSNCTVCKVNEAMAYSTICYTCNNLLLYGLSAKPEILAYGVGVNDCHPVLRYLARNLDHSIYLLACMLLLPSDIISIPVLMQLLYVILSVSVEALLISALGTTLGKLWFGIQVKNDDGSLLNMQQSFSRCIDVWFRGLGFLLAGITTITQLSAYKYLTSHRITRWDRDGSFTIHHEPLSIFRILFGIAL